MFQIKEPIIKFAADDEEYEKIQLTNILLHF